MAGNGENEKSDKYVLSSVDHALDILDLFFENEALTAADAARLLGLSRSTAFRFLVTLEKRGFLTRAESGKYRLGLNILSLGMVAQSRMELVPLVHPHLVRLAESSGETAHLAIPDGPINIMFIDKAVSRCRLKTDLAPDFRPLAHCAAAGKALLAYQPEQFINQYLRRVAFVQTTPNSIRDARGLLEVIDRIRERGYASDDEEIELGLTCYAMPLMDSGGHVLAAVSLSGPTTRMTAKKDYLLELLRTGVDEMYKTIR